MLREARLGNQNRQESDGSFNAPVQNAPSRDGVREQQFAFSDLASYPETVASGLIIPGVLCYGVQLSPASDPSTVILLSIDDGANYIRMTPGVRVDFPFLCPRLYIKGATNLPNTSQTFWLDYFYSKKTVITAGSSNGNGSNVGGSLGLVTVFNPVDTVGPPATSFLAARPTRWQVELTNQGPADVYVGFLATVTGLTGRLLAAGGTVVIRSTLAIYILGAGVARVDCIEIYSPT